MQDHPFIVIMNFKEMQCFSNVCFLVQREGWIVARIVVTICSIGILFLNFGTIEKNDFCQFTGGRGTVNFATKAIFDQHWKVTTMVEVCMCKNDRVNTFRVYRKRSPVQIAKFFQSLKQATVN